MAATRPRAFLDVSIAAQPAGRLVLELFADETPKTCENFLALCNGTHKDLTYALSPFHRVIDEFMIQGGDITAGDGTGGESIFGGEFEDENLTWRDMDAGGLLCMANRGRDTNSSQFFITLEPCPHLNGKHTVFGRLVSGRDVLDKVAKVDVDRNDRPKQPVLIVRCGQLEKKTKAEPVRRSASREVSPPRERTRHRSISPERRREQSPVQTRSRSPLPERETKRRRDRSPTDRNERDRSPRRNGHEHRRDRRSRSRDPEDRCERHRRDRRSRSRSPRRRRSHSRDRNGGPRRFDNERRRGGGGSDRYRPRFNNPQAGRLTVTYDTSGAGSEGVIFKGRGAMKYRER